MDNIDAIIEEETRIIEEKILQKNQEPQQSDAPAIIDNKKTKNSIIEDINKIEELAGLPVTPANKLKRNTKDELMKIMAELLNKTGSGEPIMPSAEPDKFFAGPEEIKQHKKAEGPDVSTMAKHMVVYNELIVKVLESLSIKYRDYFDGAPLLEGATESIKRVNPELQMTFELMIKKYGNSVTQYVDPFLMYGSIMLTSLAPVAAENLLKKKKTMDSK